MNVEIEVLDETEIEAYRGRSQKPCLLYTSGISHHHNITLTPDECDTLNRYAVNGIIANADHKRLKEKLASAEQTVSIWKQRYEAVSEKYMELKQKAQPFLDALEIASERVRAFINSILIRGKETQEHKHPARKRGQDMEL